MAKRRKYFVNGKGEISWTRWKNNFFLFLGEAGPFKTKTKALKYVQSKSGGENNI